MLIDHFLRVYIKVVEEWHSARVLEDLRNLRARRDKLKHVTVILDRPRTILGSMAHL